MNTDPKYSPWSLLPAPEPRTVSPPDNYFYDKVAKHLIRDVVRIMMNGLAIDLEKVSELEDEIDKTLEQVNKTLSNNKYVKEFIKQRNKAIIEAYKQDRKAKLKQPKDFIKPFRYNDITHRSYFMHIYAQKQGIIEPTDTLPTGVPKWSAKLVKKLAITRPILQRLLTGDLQESHSIVKEAMELLAKHKCDIYNKKYLKEIENPVNLPKKYELKPFNPNSPDDKHGLLTGLLGLESGKLTDAYIKWEKECKKAEQLGKSCPDPPKNKYSWGRKQLEPLLNLTTDKNVKEILQALIDFAFGSKIKSAFIPAFYKYTVDGRLYGSLKIFGAKSLISGIYK